jgi:hypothetical protein
MIYPILKACSFSYRIASLITDFFDQTSQTKIVANVIGIETAKYTQNFSDTIHLSGDESVAGLKLKKVVLNIA